MTESSNQNKQRNVVFYSRVATDKEARLRLEMNASDWRDEQKTLHPEWNVVGSFADSGLLGERSKTRFEFHKMMELAPQGKFDLIVARDVLEFSTFASESYRLALELADMGIEIFFVNENLWTLDSKGMISLSYMASLSGEEYEPIAQKLIDTGKCEDTPYGKLYVNEEIPVEEFFDGEHLPPYFDRDFQIACFLDNGTDRDFMMLPCTDTELLRSAKRLNTSFPYDLKVSIEDFKDHNSDLISRLFKGADIYTLNRYANLVARFSDEKKEKFTAVLDYVNRSFLDLGGLGSLSAAVKIGNALEAFTYYPNAMDDEELGMTLLEEHDVPEELWQYFDSESYGEDFRKEERGDFSDSGYVGINDHQLLRQCMTQNQGMGGIE